MRQQSPPFSMDSYGPLNPSRVDKTAAIAATRQKSCNACVRGKRRCDKKAPKCTRCSSKGLDCVYARVPPGADANTVLLDDDYFTSAASNSGNGMNSRDDSQTSTSEIPDFANLGGFVDMPSLAGSSAGNTSPGSSLDYTMDSSDVSTGLGAAAVRGGANATAAGSASTNAAAPAEFMHMDDMSGFSIADLLAANNPGLTGDLWDMHAFPLDEAACEAAANSHNHNHNHNHNTTTTTTLPQENNLNTFNLSNLSTNFDAATLSGKADPNPLAVVTRPPLRDLSMLRQDCDNCAFDMLEIHDPRSRPGHVLKFFSEMHATFSRTRTVPFVHPRLFAKNLPKTVMTAFCASSAYANRTPETKGWTVKLVADAVKEVYTDGERAGTDAEKLARVQGLLLLNTIRMLDGDLMLRAMAEKELNVQVDWTMALIKARDELQKAMPKSQWTDRAFPPKTWESWQLLESIRRTIQASIFFVCLITILKGESPQCTLWSQSVQHTASRHLWEAQSSVDFYRAWRDKPRFLIEDMEFREFWQYATPEDLDEHTRLLLTTQTGMEAMEHFMSGDATVKSC